MLPDPTFNDLRFSLGWALAKETHKVETEAREERIYPRPEQPLITQKFLPLQTPQNIVVEQLYPPNNYLWNYCPSLDSVSHSLVLDQEEWSEQLEIGGSQHLFAWEMASPPPMGPNSPLALTAAETQLLDHHSRTFRVWHSCEWKASKKGVGKRKAGIIYSLSFIKSPEVWALS